MCGTRTTSRRRPWPRPLRWSGRRFPGPNWWRREGDMAREAEARVLRATDEELEELARGPMGGGPAGSRSVAELAAQERWRRKESRRRDEEMRTAALASTRAAEPRPGP